MMAEVGAAAALLGLIFVCVSIILKKIISIPALPGRAFEALLMPLAIPVISSLMLIPHQTQTAAILEVLAAGTSVWITVTLFDIAIWRIAEARFRRRYAFIMGIIQVDVLSVPSLRRENSLLRICWPLLADDRHPSLVIMAIFNAGVLPVEINR